MTSSSDNPGFSRRAVFGAAAALSGLGVSALAAREAQAAMKGKKDPLLMNRDGTYPQVALAKEMITLGVVQTRVRAVDIANVAKSRADNLNHLLESIDKAQGWGGPKDILFFHEFPITGYSDRWDRKQALTAAIDIEGPEVAAVAAKAKQYNCYIVFGSYAKDPDWPNHLLSITFIASPEGKIIDRHWKARNIKGVFVGFELFTTTIYDVLDQYVEMYGRDQVLPITRTPYGNIVTSSVQREPELFRAFAMKGGEIFLRTASGGFTKEDIMATSMYNQVYTAVCNNALSPNNPGFFEAAGMVGGSAVYGPDGKLIDEAESENETIVTARLPMAQYRQRSRQPVIHWALYSDVFDAYVERYPPNLFASYLPSDGRDAARFLKDKAVWKK
jgi:predicted amidohydrolase